MANYYETLFIVRPNADEDTVQGTVTAVRDHITGATGEILFEATWGARKLAYPVADFNEGIYVQMNFSAPPAYPPTLERIFRLSEDVIRSIVLRTDGPPPEEMPNYLQVGGETTEESGGEHGPEDARQREPEDAGRRRPEDAGQREVDAA